MTPLRVHRQRGYMLVTVMVFAFLLAAVAFLVSHQSAIETNMAAAEFQHDELRYLTDAGMAHAEWAVDRANCSNYTLSSTPFGAHNYTAIYTPTSGSPVNIAVTATLANGATRTRARTDVHVMEQPATLTLQPDAADGKDTSLHGGGQASKNYGTATPVWVDNNVPHRSLFEFDLSALPPGTEIISAQLELYADSIDVVSNATVGVHRITQAWVEGSGDNLGLSPADGATFDSYDGVNSWTSPGGDFHATAEATVTATQTSAQWYLWDVSTLVQDWVDGTYPNFGFIVVGDSGYLEKMNFASSDTGDPTRRPRLTINYVCECGVSGAASTLVSQPDGSAGRDTRIFNAQPLQNYGSAPVVVVENQAGAAQHALLEFDVSAIPANSTVTSAMLDLYATVVTQAGIIDVHRVTSPWIEGEATWNDASSGGVWSTPGGDYDAVIADSVVITGVGTHSLDVTSIVSEWIQDGVLNAGVLLKGQVGTEMSFASSENPTAAYKPKLQIDFTCPCGVNCQSIDDGSAVSKNLLFVVGAVNNPTAKEEAHQALVESWGYTVEFIDDDASQSEFDVSVARNDVAFLTNDVTASRVDTKLVAAPIGVVTSEANLSDEFGLASSIAWDSGATIEINDNTHYITSPFESGELQIFTLPDSLAHVTGTLAPDLGKLASSTSGFALVTLDAGETTFGGGAAAGRRAQLPWAGNTFDPADLNANGELILQRALEWGAGIVAGGGGTGSAEATVSSGSDDAEEISGTGWMYLDSGDLELPIASDFTDIVGIRFVNLAVPPGATITAASIQFQVDEATTAATSLQIHGQAADNPSTFQSTAYDISSRPLTAASVAWNPQPWNNVGERGPDQLTPDLASIAQELVSRPGWASGNAMVFTFRGSGRRNAEAFEAGPASAATLSIDYSEGASPPAACSGTYRDEFNLRDYNGDDGSLNWSTDWIEIAESNGATSGDVQVLTDQSDFQLRLQNKNRGIEREADLAGAVSATLDYDYRRDGLDGASDFTSVEISANGDAGPWEPLATYAGAATDPGYQSASHDISAWISANTRIRFVNSSSMGKIDKVWFDNVEIACTP